MQHPIHSDLVPVSRTEGTTVIASLRGEIDLHNSSELRDTVLSLLTPDVPPKLVLNLGEVPYMDSSGIAVLVEALGRVPRRQQNLPHQSSAARPKHFGNRPPEHPVHSHLRRTSRFGRALN